MGKAIMLPNLDFSEKNLGQVTIFTPIHISSLLITGDASIESSSNMGIYDVEYTPDNTTERGVVWSIEGGEEYATISQDGVVSVLEGAIGAPVKIRATSTYNSSIYNERTILVTYVSSEITGLNIVGPASVDNYQNKQIYSVEYIPEFTPDTGVEWSVDDESVATIDSDTGELSVLASGNVEITATSSVNPSISATKQVACVYNDVEFGGLIRFTTQKQTITFAQPTHNFTDTKVKVKAGGSGSIYFGVRDASKANKCIIYLSNANSQCAYGSISHNASITTQPINIFDLGPTEMYINGTKHGGTNTLSNPFPGPLTIPYNTGGSPYSMLRNVDFESIEITELGVVTHNYIAAKFGEDWGFYDTITDTFISTKNSGTTFISANA